MQRSADWMNQARRDLEHARNDAAQGFYEWSCFSAQQAAEKAVKAVFQNEGAEAWGHAVSELLLELSRVHPVPDAISDAAKELDKNYITARYPDALPSGSPTALYTRTEADRSVNYAETIVEFCQSLLSAPESR